MCTSKVSGTFFSLCQEAQIFLMSVTLSALPQHFALGRAQCGK
jgi:hypothetical protein